MSERKVLTKYYPPDFDPSAITRTRGLKTAGPKVQTVRLMAPFSMKVSLLSFLSHLRPSDSHLQGAVSKI
jgi:hypothetical protein